MTWSENGAIIKQQFTFGSFLEHFRFDKKKVSQTQTATHKRSLEQPPHGSVGKLQILWKGEANER